MRCQFNFAIKYMTALTITFHTWGTITQLYLHVKMNKYNEGTCFLKIFFIYFDTYQMPIDIFVFFCSFSFYKIYNKILKYYFHDLTNRLVNWILSGYPLDNLVVFLPWKYMNMLFPINIILQSVHSVGLDTVFSPVIYEGMLICVHNLISVLPRVLRHVGNNMPSWLKLTNNMPSGKYPVFNFA